MDWAIAEPHPEPKIPSALHAQSLRAQWSGISEGDHLLVRRTLLAWVRGAGAADATTVPPFIRNKLAQLVVFVIQVRRTAAELHLVSGSAGTPNWPCCATVAGLPQNGKNPMRSVVLPNAHERQVARKFVKMLEKEHMLYPSAFCSKRI